MAPGLQITSTTHLSTLIKSSHMEKPLSRTEPGWHDHSRPMGGEHLGKEVKKSSQWIKCQTQQLLRNKTDLKHPPEIVPMHNLQQFQHWEEQCWKCSRCSVLECRTRTSQVPQPRCWVWILLHIPRPSPLSQAATRAEHLKHFSKFRLLCWNWQFISNGDADMEVK